MDVMIMLVIPPALLSAVMAVTVSATVGYALVRHHRLRNQQLRARRLSVSNGQVRRVRCKR